MMGDIVFFFLLFAFNTMLLFTFDVQSSSWRPEKKRLIIWLIAVLVCLTIFAYKQPEKYLWILSMSLPLFLMLTLRFVVYKSFSLPSKDESKRRMLVRRFFDKVVIPLFVVFFSVSQFLFLFVFNRNTE